MRVTIHEATNRTTLALSYQKMTRREKTKMMMQVTTTTTRKMKSEIGVSFGAKNVSIYTEK